MARLPFPLYPCKCVYLNAISVNLFLVIQSFLCYASFCVGLVPASSFFFFFPFDPSSWCCCWSSIFCDLLLQHSCSCLSIPHGTHFHYVPGRLIPFSKDVCRQSDHYPRRRGWGTVRDEVCLRLAVMLLVVGCEGMARVSASPSRLPVASNALRLLRAVLPTEQSAATGIPACRGV